MPIRKIIKAKPVLEMDPDAKIKGAEAITDADQVRLKGGLGRVFDFMLDGKWHTLEEISDATNVPQASASAHLRTLRKEKFGSHTVERQSRGSRDHGLFEYKLVL